MAKRRPQSDHRADTRGGALAGLPHCVADSAAYLDLTVFERCVLAEVLRCFNGYNNGSVVLSYEQMGERLKGPNTCRINNGRIARAIVSLLEHGFLAEPTPEKWLARRAREYRLTFISSGKAPPFRPASNEYLRWTPAEKKNDGNAASPERGQSGDARSLGPKSASDARSPDTRKNGSFALPGDCSSGDAASPLIGKPYRDPELEWQTAKVIPFENRAASHRCANELCAKPFIPDPRGVPQRFCSERCRKRVEDRRRRQRLKAARQSTGHRQTADA